MTEGNEGK